MPCATFSTLTTLGRPGVPTVPTIAFDVALPPKKLVATAVHEYPCPVSKPVTVTGEVALDFHRVAPLDVGTQVTRYERIELPLLGPARNETCNDPFAVGAGPDTTDVIVGAPGEPTINGGDDADPTLGPTALVADTLHV